MATPSIQHHVHNSQDIAPSTSRFGAKHGEGLSPPPSLMGPEPPESVFSFDSGGSSSPEHVYYDGVPNPFAVGTPQAKDWSSQQHARPVPPHSKSAPFSVRNPIQPGTGMPQSAAVLSSGLSDVSSSSQKRRAPGPVPSPLKSFKESAVASVASGGNGGKGGGGTGLNQRRQKRLERNRESARLSRRRRKQYLEILEERVNNLSLEMDRGRREHVAVAVDTLKEKKRQALVSLDPNSVHSLDKILNVTSAELRVAATFQTQQIRSLSLPSDIKFLLWLTLQNDSYFRGGRAASERLSAARIGERMLNSGSNRVSPAHGMWPLFCNEVGLSYDQEEKVRGFQRTLLASADSWLERHKVAACSLVIQSEHDCIQALGSCIGQRQSSILGRLSAEQKRRFLSWADKNTERIALKLKQKESSLQIEFRDGFSISKGQHDAANLYILNHRLQNILGRLPRPAPLVSCPYLKRFSRRPSFESLGSQVSQENRNESEGSLSREESFPSSGSLKRSASELSEMGDEERPQITCVPEEAESAAAATIEASLGFVKNIIPKPPPPPPEPVAPMRSSFTIPPPPPKPSFHAPQKVPMSRSQGHMQQILPMGSSPINARIAPSPALLPPPAPKAPFYLSQQSQSAPTFPAVLPPHLTIVPEDSFLHTNIEAEDFLFDLAEEDWAIGEGFEMDTT